MAIKKAFTAIHAVLAANEGKQVKTIMPELVELMSAKSAGGGASSVHRDADGNVVAILDYYFKKWLPVEFVEFGAKANSASGLSTMCKLGTSLWSKQQREFKNGKEQLLEQVASGEIQPTDIQAELDQLEEARVQIEDYPIPELAFDSVEELEAADHDAMAEAHEAYYAAEAEDDEPAN